MVDGAQNQGVEIPVTTGEFPVQEGPSTVPERDIRTDIQPPKPTSETVSVPVNTQQAEAPAMQAALSELDKAAAQPEAPVPSGLEFREELTGADTHAKIDESMKGNPENLEAVVSADSDGPDQPSIPAGAQMPSPVAAPEPVASPAPEPQSEPAPAIEPASEENEINTTEAPIETPPDQAPMVGPTEPIGKSEEIKGMERALERLHQLQQQQTSLISKNHELSKQLNEAPTDEEKQSLNDQILATTRELDIVNQDIHTLYFNMSYYMDTRAKQAEQGPNAGGK